jgi:hypothetical protein
MTHVCRTMSRVEKIFDVFFATTVSKNLADLTEMLSVGSSHKSPQARPGLSPLSLLEVWSRLLWS